MIRDPGLHRGSDAERLMLAREGITHSGTNRNGPNT